MKKLITILLIIVSAKVYSQTNSKVFITFDLVFEYEKECYNDSTRVHTHKAKYYDNCYVQTGNLAHGYSFRLICDNDQHYEWIHKEPTFSDFIKWLHKKNNDN